MPYSVLHCRPKPVSSRSIRATTLYPLLHQLNRSLLCDVLLQWILLFSFAAWSRRNRCSCNTCCTSPPQPLSLKPPGTCLCLLTHAGHLRSASTLCPCLGFASIAPPSLRRLFSASAMGKHHTICKCSIYPEGHMVAKADRFKHHLDLQQV